jgi:hypothetical protein
MTNDLYRPQARVIPPGGDHADPLSQTYKAYLFRRMGDGLTSVFSHPQPYVETTATFSEGTSLEDETFARIPVDFARPLYDALGEALGIKPVVVESDTLERWLAVERQRVDDLLYRTATLRLADDGT